MKLKRRKFVMVMFYLFLALILFVGVWFALRLWFNYLDHYIKKHLDEGTFISSNLNVFKFKV